MIDLLRRVSVTLVLGGKSGGWEGGVQEGRRAGGQEGGVRAKKRGKGKIDREHTVID
jgi:hypothetical protein